MLRFDFHFLTQNTENRKQNYSFTVSGNCEIHVHDSLWGNSIFHLFGVHSSEVVVAFAQVFGFVISHHGSTWAIHRSYLKHRLGHKVLNCVAQRNSGNLKVACWRPAAAAAGGAPPMGTAAPTPAAPTEAGVCSLRHSNATCKYGCFPPWPFVTGKMPTLAPAFRPVPVAGRF